MVSRRIRELFHSVDDSGDGTNVGVMAMDLRGHGQTKVNNDTENYSLEVLTDDFIQVCEGVWNKMGYVDDERRPSVILIGHSVGGSIVANSSQEIGRRLKRLVGVVVLDVVEGPTVESLNTMSQILSRMPINFDSVEEAIAWHVSSMTLRNRESAAISVPGLIEEDQTITGKKIQMDYELTTD